MLRRIMLNSVPHLVVKDKHYLDINIKNAPRKRGVFFRYRSYVLGAP